MRVCLDNTFISDFLDGLPYTESYLSTLSGQDEVYVPSIVRFEALVPTYREQSKRTVARVEWALESFRSINFEQTSAKEAAEIRGFLLDHGNEIGSPDVLIAGIARNIDALLITSNTRHFSRVPDLSVHDPKPSS